MFSGLIVFEGFLNLITSTTKHSHCAVFLFFLHNHAAIEDLICSVCTQTVKL